MITLISGAAGSGKSHRVYSLAAESLAAGKTVFLIVPEQSAVEAERSMTELCTERGIPTVSLEIVSFRRLANRVFRQYGGLSYRYIGQGGKAIVMWRALSECAQLLRCYGGISVCDAGTVAEMTAAADGFTQYGITPRQLDSASEELRAEGKTLLADKLADLSVIYAAFKGILKKDHDDPREDIPRLARILETNNFFGGSDVYCDAFYGFTPDEYDVLRHIIRQADNFTAALQSAGEATLFESQVRDVRLRIASLIPDGAERRQINIDGDARHSSETLRKLTHALCAGSTAPLSGGNGICLIECRSRYEEAEAAAAQILRYVDAGGCFRDCSVIVRDPELWRGIIDPVLESHGIPCFMSRRGDILRKPPVRLIIAALEAVGGGWRLEDMIALIKTGLSGLTAEEGDILERYASAWRISGRRWYDEYEWNMNPDGYSDRLTETGARILSTANTARRKLCDPLSLLTLGRASVKDYCTAVYRYTESIGLEKTVAESDEEEPVQLLNEIYGALDCMVTVAGELTVGADTAAKLLTLALTGVSIGRIPTCTDEVTVGGADLFRPAHCRHALLLGCADGEFPASVTEKGLFSESERIELEELGIELSRGIAERAAEEQLYFYMAASAPSDMLTLTYSPTADDGGTQKPSSGWNRIRTLFPALTPVRFADIPLSERLRSARAMFDRAVAVQGTPEAEIIMSVLSECRKNYGTEAIGAPLTLGRLKLSPEITDRIFGDTVSISNTTAEAYVKCAFGYFGRYVLGLREATGAEFRGADTGNYIHSILQSFCRAVGNGEIDPGNVQPQELDSFAELESERYISSVLRGSTPDARSKNIFRRLSATAKLLLRDLAGELKNSSFAPSFFELPIGHEKGAVPPQRIPIGDGRSAEVRGRVDRVDLKRSGDELLIRITDYKTGAFRSPRGSAENGIGMQLLLYLCSLCSDSDRVKKLLSDGERAARNALKRNAEQTDSAAEEKADSSENKKTAGGSEPAAEVYRDAVRADLIQADTALVGTVKTNTARADTVKTDTTHSNTVADTAQDNKPFHVPAIYGEPPDGDESLPARIVPAGAVYMSVRTPEISAQSPSADSESAEADVLGALRRDGLIADDPEIIDAMDRSHSGHYIPVKYNKNGEPSGNTLCSREELAAECAAARDKAAQIAECMRSGIADADPMTTPLSQPSPCAYCDLKPICRRIED